MNHRWIARFLRLIKNPDRIVEKVLKRVRQAVAWQHYYDVLRDPKISTSIESLRVESEMQYEIATVLRAQGFAVQDYYVDLVDYRAYAGQIDYRTRFPQYWSVYGPNIVEKSLEHYVAARLLNLSEKDIYVDIASEFSPVPEIYSLLYSCKTYRQDLEYPPGIHGDQIGGDAADMPVHDGFASKIGLHCSFEHFEGDSDIRFIRESSRILREGGKLCILPLYMFRSYAIMTNPCVAVPGKVRFDEDAILYCVRGPFYRHSRHYDVPHLVSRVRNNLGDLKLTIHLIRNWREVGANCYLRFAAVFEK